jgi:hypothetical protein
MKLFDVRSVLAIAAMALLSACGGSDTPAADSAPVAAPLAANANGPVADCEAEGCNRPRIIDGLAEQYRAGAALQPAPAVEPVQAGVLPAQAPASGAAPAVPVAPQAPAPN